MNPDTFGAGERVLVIGLGRSGIASCEVVRSRGATVYATLQRDGTTDAFRDRMFDFYEINAIVGTPEMLALGRRYEAGDPAK